MSVRNILDGTIKVGGDGSMPVEPVIPENLEVKTVKASGNVMGKNLVATIHHLLVTLNHWPQQNKQM